MEWGSWLVLVLIVTMTTNTRCFMLHPFTSAHKLKKKSQILDSYPQNKPVKSNSRTTAVQSGLQVQFVADRWLPSFKLSIKWCGSHGNGAAVTGRPSAGVNADWNPTACGDWVMTEEEGASEGRDEWSTATRHPRGEEAVCWPMPPPILSIQSFEPPPPVFPLLFIWNIYSLVIPLSLQTPCLLFSSWDTRRWSLEGKSSRL